MAFTTPGTAVAGDVLTAAFWNSNVRDNFNEVAPLFAAWTAWTPVVEQSGTRTSTIGNARYLKIGNIVQVMASLTITQTGVTGNYVACTLPFALTSRITTSDHAVGSFFYFRGTRYAGTAVIARGFTGASKVVFISGQAASNLVGIDPAFATANGDVMSFSVQYETD
jgi:hypothetical protein